MGGGAAAVTVEWDFHRAVDDDTVRSSSSSSLLLLLLSSSSSGSSQSGKDGMIPHSEVRPGCGRGVGVVIVDVVVVAVGVVLDKDAIITNGVDTTVPGPLLLGCGCCRIR